MGSWVNLDRTKISLKVYELSRDSVKRAAEVTAVRAAQNVVEMGLVNTGRLEKSFRVREVTLDPMFPKFEVYSNDPKAIYPEKGTKGSTARPGHFLRFKPKGSAVFVFAKHTRPIRPYGFMKKAMESITIQDFML